MYLTKDFSFKAIKNLDNFWNWDSQCLKGKKIISSVSQMFEFSRQKGLKFHILC